MWRARLGLTALVVAEGSSDGSSEAGLSVPQVFPLQIHDGDGLPVKLIAQLLVLGDGPGDHQHVLKQEHMQLLQEHRQGFSSHCTHSVVINLSIFSAIICHCSSEMTCVGMQVTLTSLALLHTPI